MLARLLEWVWSNLGILVPMAGFLGLLVGVALVMWVSRGVREPGSLWRYRDPRKREPARTPRPGRVDVGAARGTARFMLGLTIFLGFLGLFLWLAAPGFSGGMTYERPWYQVALPLAGPAIYLIGLGWIIRIYRADPEPGERTWRYRS